MACLDTQIKFMFSFKEIWKKGDPLKALKTTKLYMRDNEKMQHPSRPLAPT
jgi:hypothetical protein